MTRRVPLILALAVARLSSATAQPAPTSRWAGRVVSSTPEDGALLVDTGRSLVLLVLASDAVLREGDGAALAFDDVAPGDVVEWHAERHGGIAVVQEVTRLAAAQTV